MLAALDAYLKVPMHVRSEEKNSRGALFLTWRHCLFLQCSRCNGSYLWEKKKYLNNDWISITMTTAEALKLQSIWVNPYWFPYLHTNEKHFSSWLEVLCGASDCAALTWLLTLKLWRYVGRASVARCNFRNQQHIQKTSYNKQRGTQLQVALMTADIDVSGV